MLEPKRVERSGLPCPVRTRTMRALDIGRFPEHVYPHCISLARVNADGQDKPRSFTVSPKL